VVLKKTVLFDGRREHFLLRFLLGLLGQKNGLDVREHTSLRDGDTGQKFVQLFVVADGQLKVTRDDPALLVVTSSVSSQLEDLSGQVLQDGRQVDGRSRANSFSVVSFPQETVDTSNWELESSPERSCLGLCLCFSSFAASRHLVSRFVVYANSITLNSVMKIRFPKIAFLYERAWLNLCTFKPIRTLRETMPKSY